MTSGPLTRRRRRFPAGIISRAVWPYRVSSLGLRDAEPITAERGAAVTHGGIRRRRLESGADPAAVFRGGPFSGQDRLDTPVRRLRRRGLEPRV